MRPGLAALLMSLVLLATAALAHQGVQNPAVMARMESMKHMNEALKVVGEMAKGTTAFDADAVEAAVERMRAETERTPALFEARETDPRMEAVPALWDNWDDFLDKNDAMIDALAAPVPATLDETRPWLRSIGTACAACHEDYRE